MKLSKTQIIFLDAYMSLIEEGKKPVVRHLEQRLKLKANSFNGWMQDSKTFRAAFRKLLEDSIDRDVLTELALRTKTGDISTSTIAKIYSEKKNIEVEQSWEELLDGRTEEEEEPKIDGAATKEESQWLS